MKISQELAGLKEKTEQIIQIEKNLEEISEIVKLEDEDLEQEIQEKISDLVLKIKKQEISILLSGKYDKGNAILSIYAGAGGQDAQDWATMLLRMYERYCEKRGFSVKILHRSFGEAGGPEGRIGIKTALMEIKGKFAFGFLKKETGVHRLVRISPFSPQKLRHTSFALVEVLPEISGAESEIKINPEDLRVDVFRASGPGGQYVNKRESAVRITHLPTGITVSCQNERLQGLNKEKAMKLLYSKLYQLKQKQKQKEVKEIKGLALSLPNGERVSVEWGNQIRSYVLHPYKMVKDLRTGVETSNVESVLNGDLEQFIEAEVQLLKSET